MVMLKAFLPCLLRSSGVERSTGGEVSSRLVSPYRVLLDMEGQLHSPLTRQEDSFVCVNEHPLV